MRFALGLYRRLVAIQARSQMQYRLSFFLDVVAAALITTLGFGSLAMVLQRFENLGGWTLGEVAFLYGIVEASFGTMDMLFSGFDPPYFGQLVRRGTLDQILLRPTSVFVQVLGARLILRRVGRILQGLAVLVIALALNNIHWTVFKVLYLPAVMVSQVCFFGGLFIIGAAITFWTVESIEVVNILTYGGNEMIAYPMHIYQEWMRRFFTFIVPAIFLNYAPALYFLDKPDPLGLPAWTAFLSPVVGVGTLAVALVCWRFGLRHYQSTGT
jgi:ABC-2 type transport system permease protein